ncbi:MAG: PAS domain-containing protein, partial [Rhodobacterales bacterium]|nr:PAS domain-containing protein [Rhodobacterales bacterium]
MTPLSSSKDLPKLAAVDRRLALAFGALILFMMLAVLLAGGLYVRGSIEREQSRLSALTSQVLANAVSRISFSGKHHSRLLLEEIKAAQPSILYLRLVDGSGVIQAHSDPAQNGLQIDAKELPLIRPVLQGVSAQTDRHAQLDGVPIREVSIAYRGGYDNAVISVLQIGISELEHQRDLARGTWFIALLVIGLLLLGILVTWRISVHFGKPVRQLVRTLGHEQALLRTLISTLPDLVWVKDANGVYLACNRRFEDFFGAGEQNILGKTDFDFVARELAVSFR